MFNFAYHIFWSLFPLHSGGKVRYYLHAKVTKADATIYPFDVTITFDDNSTIKRSISFDVPIKRNALTTVIGNLFYDAFYNMQLTINENFDTANNATYDYDGN